MTKPNPSIYTDIRESKNDGIVTIGNYAKVGFITLAVSSTTAGRFVIGCVALNKSEAKQVIKALQKAVKLC